MRPLLTYMVAIEVIIIDVSFFFFFSLVAPNYRASDMGTHEKDFKVEGHWLA